MSSSEVGRKFTFWVVYDATGDQQFVKMDSDTGCLTMFGDEESAAAFASGLVGVDYKKVVLYSCPQPALVEALEQIAAWPDGGHRYGQRRIKKFAAEALTAHRKGVEE